MRTFTLRSRTSWRSEIRRDEERRKGIAAYGPRTLAVGVLSALVVLVLPESGTGHGLDPALLHLREAAPGTFEVLWRTSAMRLPGSEVRPRLPLHCRATSAPEETAGPDRITSRWSVDCGATGIGGATIEITDLDAAKINVLLEIERASGAPLRTVLSQRRPAYVVPSEVSRLDVIRAYGVLGVEHILGGPDHLLFVLGLLLLVPTPRRLVQTITAFTLGHSITLSAAVLRLTSVPSRPIEVLIAASVLWLAVELAESATTETRLRRWPWLLAAGFGLLHGFGFAGALAEAGLPADAVPLALLSFNAGIEIGQLAFVAVALAAGAIVSRYAPGALCRIKPTAVYAMGILAAFWCFERIAILLR